MAIYTNRAEYGGLFHQKIDSLLNSAVSVTIATGYMSAETLLRYNDRLTSIVRRGGNVIFLVGMAYFEGLHKATYDTMCEINRTLTSLRGNDQGVRVVWDPTGYHGKLYRFGLESTVIYFVGSSNFSPSGLEKNIELTTEITDLNTVRETDAFLGWLLADEQSVNIANCYPFPIIEEVTPPRRRLIRRRGVRPALVGIPYVDISLARVDHQPRSNLNAFFGKGRWNRSTGIVVPRDWFEVEVIVDVDTIRNPTYPKGDFLVRTDDGQTFRCRTQGDYYKNLRSKDDLKILGRWIKGKLQQSGALVPFEPVTSQTLRDYGRDYIRLHKTSDSEYFMEF